jgi:pimeloyl-ACP methyl ester carboxylesterase
MEPRDQLVILNGLRFHYREWGQPDAPPLVLLHGFSAHSRLWDTFARAVVEHFHIFALDQRGHGETAWADEYSVDLMIADLAAFVRALRLDRFALIGHSMGGRNAYGYAAQYQETLTQLVLVDIAPEIPAEASNRVQRTIAQTSDTFDSPEEAFAAVRAANPFPPDDELRARTLSGLMLREDGRWTYRYDRALRDPGRFRMPFAPAENWALLRSITTPTLLVRGAESDLLTPTIAQRVAEEMPNCTLVTVSAAGHPVPLDNPQGFIDAVKPWLIKR